MHRQLGYTRHMRKPSSMKDKSQEKHTQEKKKIFLMTMKVIKGHKKIFLKNTIIRGRCCGVGGKAA